MFTRARIRLTAWYLLIIMFVTTLFSLGIYEVLTSELDRVERMQRIRIERNYPDRIRPQNFYLDPNLVEETKDRLIFTLFIINGTILGASAIAGYFLAGRTLKPIQDMVDDQNRFIADASHELRTPLTSLKTEIEVGLRDKSLTLETAKDLLSSNLEEANNLQVLSDSLIKLTRFQKNENGITFETISLKEILDEAIKRVGKMAGSHNIEIINAAADFEIKGSRMALTELFMILLDNAIKYNPNKSQITINTQKEDGHVLISVSDRGIGIEPEDIPHIFDRFYRSDKSRNKLEAGGYGLGLSIAKQIVDRHHGSIKVNSEINKGSTFTILLPLHHQHRII